MTEQTEQESKSQEINELLPGQILAAARQKQGLELEELAEQLKVPLNVLQDIEADSVSDKLPEAFVRGYIRAFARKVGVEESLVLTKVETTGAIDTNDTHMQSFSRRNKRKALEKRLALVSWILVIVLVIALVIWWFQDGGLNKFAPVASTNTTEVSAEQTAQQVTSVPEQSNTLIDQQPESTEIEVESQPVDAIDLSTVAATEEEISQQETTDERTTANSMQQQASAPNTETASVTESQSEDAESTQPISLTPEQTALLADTGVADEEGFIRVEMAFEELCYVEVRDVTGELIAFGNKEAGYTMNLNAQGPLSVLLGHKQGVSIRVNECWKSILNG